MLTAVLVGITALLSDLILRSFIYGRGNRDSKGGAIVLILFAVGIPVVLAPRKGVAILGKSLVPSTAQSGTAGALRRGRLRVLCEPLIALHKRP